MSYRSRRNEARHRQLALLYTFVTLTALVALGYYYQDLAEVGEWLQFWINPQTIPAASANPLAGVG